jgi:hypothetical protein
MRSRTSLAVLVLMSVVLAGCGLTTRRIADIQRYPGQYFDRSVTIEGRVTSSFAGPMLPVQFYKIDDGTGEMTVLTTTTARVPSRGQGVRVEGRVEELASFGERSFGLHMREERVTVKR